MSAKDYVLGGTAPTESAPTPNHIWAFDLGKGSEGEAVRQGRDFPHVESLLIPAELARRGPAAMSGTPANKYRASKTREAHHARERWLETVWEAAGFTPLRGRQVAKVDGKWQQVAKGDCRLEMEFAPKRGASADAAEADICYTSCLLRIKLLTWKEGDPRLADWQIFKALRSALQTRGYGPVPWASKEARKQGKTPEEIEREEQKQLEQADPKYREAAGRWPAFKQSVAPEFRFPCYYDAAKMGLWNSAAPNKPTPQNSHLANSTRNVRFDRADVRAELVKLGNQAAALLPELSEGFARWQKEGWKYRHPVTGEEVTYPVHARSFGEFLCDGPAGQPDETSFEAFLNQRRAAGLQPGSFEEWMAALGQKTPKFDNRILNDCVLIPRFHVCKVDVRVAEKDDDKQGIKAGHIFPDSLLATEVTFLLKLKNILVADLEKGQRKLKAQEIRTIFEYAHRQLQSLKLIGQDGGSVKNWPGKVADCFALKKSEWGNKKKGIGLLGLRPLAGHEEVKAPKTGGRSAYSRVALRILKELILSGEAPSAFHARLLRREPELLGRLGGSPAKPLALYNDSTAQDTERRKREDTEHCKCGLLVSELKFLLQMRKEDGQPDSWENLFAPSVNAG